MKRACSSWWVSAFSQNSSKCGKYSYIRACVTDSLPAIHFVRGLCWYAGGVRTDPHNSARWASFLHSLVQFNSYNGHFAPSPGLRQTNATYQRRFLNSASCLQARADAIFCRLVNRKGNPWPPVACDGVKHNPICLCSTVIHTMRPRSKCPREASNIADCRFST